MRWGGFERVGRRLGEGGLWMSLGCRIGFLKIDYRKTSRSRDVLAGYQSFSRTRTRSMRNITPTASCNQEVS